VRTITIIAIIAAAAAAGIIAGTVLLVTPATRSAEPVDGPQEIVIGGETTPSNGSNNSSTTTDDGYRQVNVTVNGVKLVADVAETNEQRTKGLTVRDTLGENEAMLFVFETSQKYPFWMPPEMKFPIDIIWLDSNKTVVHIEANAQPCNIYPPISCPNYTPGEDAQYVLETVAGFAQKNNVTYGTQVKFDA
jgi:uncharacterized membrane protein (UPF0127 family)